MIHPRRRAPGFGLWPIILLASTLITACGGSIEGDSTTSEVTSSTTTTTTTSTTTNSGLSLRAGSTSVLTGATLTFTAAGGATPYYFAITDGAGSINTSTGVFTAPSAAGTTTIQVTDHNGNTASASVSVVQSTTTGTLTASPGYAALSASQSVTFSVSGGTSPYTMTLESGSGTVSGLTYTAPGSDTNGTLRISDSAGHSTTVTVVVTVANVAKVDIYRHYRSSNGDHMMSRDSGEGTSSGYISEGRRFSLYADQSVSGTVPLYRCMYNTSGGVKHFASLYSNCEGMTPEGILGYVAASQTSGLIPLYRFYYPTNGDRLISTSTEEASNAHYIQEQTLGYVFP